MKKTTTILTSLLLICTLFFNCTSDPVSEPWEINPSTPISGISIPELTTIAVTNIKTSSSTSGGTITSDGGSAITSRGIVWGTSANPTTANSKRSNGIGTGNFICDITSLTANTTYYVRAYATNSIGTAYGNEISFKTTNSGTVPNTPSITTASINSITAISADGGGSITSDGGSPITDRGIVWSTTANPTTANSKKSNGTGIGNYDSSITSLTANTKYYVRAYATNNTGTYYGNEITFTTSTAGIPIGSGYAMTAKVNGSLWQMNNPFNSNAATNPLFNYYPKTDFIQLQGRLGGIFGLDEIQLQIKRTDLAVGTYPIGMETFDASKTQIVMIYNSFPTDQDVIEGSLTITEVNLVNKTVKGTFSFKCADNLAPISSQNPVTTTVTDGTFNYTFN